MLPRPDFLQGMHDKIISQEKLDRLAFQLHYFKRTVVFTNGCFDILHRGHIEYLAKAARQGEFLFVGLNTDASVKRQSKGPGRPFNNEETRALQLAALSFVDAVVLFDEDTPLELIKRIRPNLLVKGADYLPENIVGADFVHEHGGAVITIPLVEGFSTTTLAEKIRKAGK